MLDAGVSLSAGVRAAGGEGTDVVGNGDVAVSGEEDSCDGDPVAEAAAPSPEAFGSSSLSGVAHAESVTNRSDTTIRWATVQAVAISEGYLVVVLGWFRRVLP